MPCGALSPSESSDSQISSDFTDLFFDRLFPDLSAESFISICGQPSQLPIHTTNYFQPPTVPVDLSSLEPQLLSDAASQKPVHDVRFQYQPQPISNEDLQFQPVSGTDLNNKLPIELEKFLQEYGSGFFEGCCEYPENAPYSMAVSSFTNEYNVY